jgi:hypothetical protein
VQPNGSSTATSPIANIGDLTLGASSFRIDVATGVAGSRGQSVPLKLKLTENACEDANLALLGLALARVAASHRRRKQVQTA